KQGRDDVVQEELAASHVEHAGHHRNHRPHRAHEAANHNAFATMAIEEGFTPAQNARITAKRPDTVEPFVENSPQIEAEAIAQDRTHNGGQERYLQAQ